MANDDALLAASPQPPTEERIAAAASRIRLWLTRNDRYTIATQGELDEILMRELRALLAANPPNTV